MLLLTKNQRETAPKYFAGWDENIFSYAELFQEFADIDPHSITELELINRFSSDAIQAAEMSRNDWLDLVLTTVIQPALPPRTFTYVHEYPADQAALARIRPGSPPVAERFELYLGQMELANGYQELTDPVEQRRRFESENSQRQHRGLSELPLDNSLLAALEQGLPECAGVALGVDRLVMVIMNMDDISGVLTFPPDA